VFLFSSTNLHDRDIQFRIPVTSENERTLDVKKGNQIGRFGIKNHRMPGADMHLIARFRLTLGLPGSRGRPRPVALRLQRERSSGQNAEWQCHKNSEEQAQHFHAESLAPKRLPIQSPSPRPPDW